MGILGFDRQSFEAALKQYLSPTTPIRSAEFLRGRDKRLEEIRRSLVQPGRQIFIYGERGVGKTSVAQTAAFEHQSSSQNPILLGCDPSSGFYRIAQDLANRLLAADPAILKITNQKKVNAGWAPFLSLEAQQSIERGRIPEFRSINEAVGALGYIALRHSAEPIAVIDEFERIKDPAERMLFADFIKQIGDQSIPLKLIFCGVGTALDELLDSHHSCYRYLSTVQLDRLGYGPRLEIIDGARKALGLYLDDTTRYRIATISDGFPHYVHLITEKLLWRIFEDPRPLSAGEANHFALAIKDAAADVEAYLKAMYEKATLKYRNDYEEVLWAVADNHELKRRSTDIFDSYFRIMRRRVAAPLARDKFNQRMNSLKRSVLKANRQGWYEFNENILRGYVRLRAEEQGVPLDIDHPLLPRSISGEVA
jgi:hypothetical protein